MGPKRIVQTARPISIGRRDEPPPLRSALGGRFSFRELVPEPRLLLLSERCESLTPPSRSTSAMGSDAVMEEMERCDYGAEPVAMPMLALSAGVSNVWIYVRTREIHLGARC